MALVSSRAFKSHALICMSHHFSAFQLPCTICSWGGVLGGEKRILQNVCQCERCWCLLLFCFVPERTCSACVWHALNAFSFIQPVPQQVLGSNAAVLRPAFHVRDPDKPVSQHGSPLLHKDGNIRRSSPQPGIKSPEKPPLHSVSSVISGSWA